METDHLQPRIPRAPDHIHSVLLQATPNFDPRCPVMIFSWPPASMPGVIRRSTRFSPNSTSA